MTDLDALERLRAEATPGEWMQDISNNGHKARGVHSEYWTILDACSDIPDLDDRGEQNVAFIVAAVNALPALIAELRQLRILADNLRGSSDWCRDHLSTVIECSASMPLEGVVRAAAEQLRAARLDAAIVSAARELVPLLIEGWDEYDDDEHQRAGHAACDALIAAVKDAAIAKGGPKPREDANWDIPMPIAPDPKAAP